MKKVLLLAILGTIANISIAQKVESIQFNLYTDSLKKGVHNYINVDAKLSNGRFAPLDSKQITLSSSYGKWDGNDLIIDSSFTKDSVIITATLQENTSIKKTIVIYLKKKPDNEVLKTVDEIFNNNPPKIPKRRKA